MPTTELSSKEPVTIPKEVRDKLEMELSSKKLIDRPYCRFSGRRLVQSLEHDHVCEIRSKKRR